MLANNKLNNNILMLFRNMFFLTVTLIILEYFNVLLVSSYISYNLLISVNILFAFIWIFLLLHKDKNKINVIYFQYGFILCLILLTIGLVDFDILNKIEFIKNIVVFLYQHSLPILFLGISCAVIDIYFRKDKILNNTDNISVVPLNTRQKIFNILKQIPKKHLFWISVSLIIIFFIGTRLIMPLFYTGGYIDEYTHIVAGQHFFQYFHLPEFNTGIIYTRGVGMSLLIGTLFQFFPNTIFVAKMAPLIVGVLSFIVLFLIARKIFSKFNVIFLLVVYSLSLGVLLNDFYIRFFIIYEFFILLCTYFFLLSKNLKSHLKKWCLVTILFLLTILFFISNDNGAYMIMIYSFISLLLYICIYMKTEVRKYIEYIKKLKLIYRALIALVTSTVLIHTFFLLGIQDKILAMFSYTNKTLFNSSLLGYQKIFFHDNLIFSIFLFIPIIFIIIELINKRKIKFAILQVLYFGFLVIFSLHLLSSPEIQIFRGIFYLLPIYYVFSFYGLNMYTKSIIVKIIVCALFIISTLSQYPNNFFEVPSIPNESIYIGGDIYKNIKDNCKDSLLISSQYPYVLKFNTINTDYYLKNVNIDDILAGDIIFNYTTKKFYTYYDNIPVISNLRDLKEIVSKNNKICYVERSPVVRVWLDKNMTDYIKMSFSEKSIDINYRLLIKQTTPK